jgi:hypothetical protein
MGTTYREIPCLRRGITKQIGGAVLHSDWWYFSLNSQVLDAPFSVFPELDVFCNRGELGGEREGNEDQPEATQVKVDPLTELVFRRSIFFATEEFVGGGACWFTSTLCLIREDGLTFRRAKEFTPLVAGLIYMQRLLFFEYTLPYRTYARVGYERRPKRNHLDQLDLIRLHYRVP